MTETAKPEPEWLTSLRDRMDDAVTAVIGDRDLPAGAADVQAIAGRATGVAASLLRSLHAELDAVGEEYEGTETRRAELEADVRALGDADGADRQAREFIRLAHRVQVIVHPDRADDGDRNHDIVNLCEHLVAAPPAMVELVESGTWDTIRYARQIGRPITIVWPDGTTTSTGEAADS